MRHYICFYSITIQFAIFLLLHSSISYAQSPTSEAYFIKITDKIGYVIDSVENNECKCVTYYDQEEYNYAALIQLPDSSVVLRIMLIDSLGSRDIIMGKAEVEKLRTSASKISLPISVIDTSMEEELMKKLTEDSIAYKRINYNMLIFPSLIKHKDQLLTKNAIGFINIGLGNSMFHNQSLYSYGLEVGLINKRSIYSLRILSINEYKILIFPNEYINDFGFLYGWQDDLGEIVLSASVGISYISGVVRGNITNTIPVGLWLLPVSTRYYEEKTFKTLGIPLQAEIQIGARHNLGLSLIFYGNINQKYSFGGILVCLRLGKTSTKK
ncbi:MAG: hypothetical protein ACOYO1_06075 [Bacteroidales bacterium]